MLSFDRHTGIYQLKTISLFLFDIFFALGLPADSSVFEFGPAKVLGHSVFYRSSLSVAFVNKKPVVPGNLLMLLFIASSVPVSFPLVFLPSSASLSSLLFSLLT